MKTRAGIEYKGRFRIAVIIIVAGYLTLVGRLVYLQVIKGDYYLKLTSINHMSRDRIPPLRGFIRDRYGEMLAVDIPVFDLFTVPRHVQAPGKEVSLLKNEGILSDVESKQILEKINKLKKKKSLKHVLIKKNLTGRNCPFDGSPLIAQASGRMLCPKCHHIFKDQLSIVRANHNNLPGFLIHTRTRRFYPKAGLTAHIVGYVNEVNKKDLKKYGKLYRKGDLIGRTGVEKAFEQQLRGSPGSRVFVRTAGGRRINPSTLPAPFNMYKDKPSVPGDDITLTIDWDLTRAADKAMRYHYSGAVVAMDIHTGEILVLYSKPIFNPNIGHFGVKKTKNFDPSIYSPMLNKALRAYPPGSTFKLITASAALTEGVVDPDTDLFCPGYYMYMGHRFIGDARYGHGKVDMFKALEVSCNVYFYQVGEALGMDMLAHYARDYFGLGQHTGIKIRESTGLIPTVRWHNRHSPSGFLPGFVLNASVGQGAVKVTPLQLARAYSALLNGGKLMRATLVKKITTHDGAIVFQSKPTVDRYLALSDMVVATIMRGMYLVVNGRSGTARHSAIKDIPFAGKTGTAQAREWRAGGSPKFKSWLKQDHAWFAGYAPASNPQIVVVAFVEHGGGGAKAAAPVVKKVIEAYYKLYPEKVVH